MIFPLFKYSNARMECMRSQEASIAPWFNTIWITSAMIDLWKWFLQSNRIRWKLLIILCLFKYLSLKEFDRIVYAWYSHLSSGIGWRKEFDSNNWKWISQWIDTFHWGATISNYSRLSISLMYIIKEQESFLAYHLEDIGNINSSTYYYDEAKNGIYIAINTDINIKLYFFDLTKNTVYSYLVEKNTLVGEYPHSWRNEWISIHLYLLFTYQEVSGCHYRYWLCSYL